MIPEMLKTVKRHTREYSPFEVYTKALYEYFKGHELTASNKTQYFEGILEEVYNFHIGGYQVCEKWLKDRKGRKLAEEEIGHYQRIVVAINETIRIMEEIDEVIEVHGGGL